jgi:magnesium-transporting ATPase (P-type)
LSKLVSKVSSSPAPISSSWQRFVLAGCHSLVQLNGTDVVGDPLDLAALRYSGWKYSREDDSYELANTKKKASSDPVRLWQIKSFPFDPSKRLSSALVLAELADKSYRLLSLVKGSPETLQRHYRHRDNAAFMKSQKGKIQELEAQGYRTISLGSQDLTNSTDLVERLFPQGLSLSKSDLRNAREQGACLHRNDFEGTREDTDTYANFDFMGFACFDTAIRQSSSRVISELRRGGIQPIMLTGDAIDAALAVSLRVGLLDEPSVALLEVDECADRKSPLIWRIVKLKGGKGATRKALHKGAKIKSVTKSSTREILKLQRRGECSIAATGPAIERLLSDQENGISQGVKSVLSDNLFSVSIIARATPALKKAVIGTLKGRCGKKVVMCGKCR